MERVINRSMPCREELGTEYSLEEAVHPTTTTTPFRFGSVNTYVVICSGVQRRKEKKSELVVVPSRSVGQRTALLPFLTGYSGGSLGNPEFPRKLLYFYN